MHPALGYITGWCMAMDYILNPLICTIWCSKAAQNFLPEVPYVLWAIGFAALFTILNLRGVETSARINEMMAAALGVVIILVVASILRYLFKLPHQPVLFTRRRSTILLPFRRRRSFEGLRLRFSPTSALTGSLRLPTRRRIQRGIYRGLLFSLA